MRALGVDLGTERVRAAITDRAQPGRYAVVVDEHAALSLAPSGEVVGSAAEERCATHPEETVSCLPRLLGRQLNDRACAVVDVERLCDPPGGEAAVCLGGQTHSVTTLCGTLFADVRRQAEDAAAALLADVVLTVPALATDAQRRALCESAAQAGWDVRRLISAPMAAWLGCGQRPQGYILVVDAGAGSVDVAVLRAEPEVLRMIAVGGAPRLGGADLDLLLSAAMLNVFAQGGGGVVNQSGRARLRLELRAAREALSEVETVSLQLPALGSVDDERVTSLRCPQLSRSTLHALMGAYLEGIERSVAETLAEAALDPGAIDAVVLSGGMARAPAVVATVERAAGQAVLPLSVPPEHMGALGAAAAASLVFADASPDLLLLEANPHSVWVDDVEVIAKNTLIPARSAPLGDARRSAPLRRAGAVVGALVAEGGLQQARVLVDADGRVQPAPSAAVQLELA